MIEKYIRTIYVFGDDFWGFYNAQTLAVQGKIDWVIDLVKTLPQIPEKYLKHIEGTSGLYEMRIKLGSNIYRIFCFFDEGRLVILLNGFQKKSEKTPKSEIIKAERLKKQYYENKTRKK